MHADGWTDVYDDKIVTLSTATAGAPAAESVISVLNRRRFKTIQPIQLLVAPYLGYRLFNPCTWIWLD